MERDPQEVVQLRWVMVVSVRVEEGGSDDTIQLGVPRYYSVSETSGVTVELERRQM